MINRLWNSLFAATIFALTFFALSACQEAAEVPVTEDAVEASETVDHEPAGESVALTLLNPNLAEESEIAALVGMTPEAATAIVKGRPFLEMLSLDDVLAPLLDEVTRQDLYGHLWVPLNLNSASKEEILLIPGVGERMAHEFDEYRPYEAMARFRREMAKYVDDVEVERLASYVFVPLDINTATADQLLGIPGVGERMKHEFEEYRPYVSVEQFRREIGKYVDDGEIARLERYFVFP